MQSIFTRPISTIDIQGLWFISMKCWQIVTVMFQNNSCKLLQVVIIIDKFIAAETGIAVVPLDERYTIFF